MPFDSSPPARADATSELLAHVARERADAGDRRRTMPDALRERLSIELDQLRGGLVEAPGPSRAIERYRAVRDAIRACDEHDIAVREAVRGAIRDAAARLRDSPTVSSLADEAVREGCAACGFSRTLISAVRGTRWVPLVVHSDTAVDPDPASLRTYVEARNEIPLGTFLAETDVVRRKIAVLVEGVRLERRTFRPIVDVAASDGYVVAPIRLGGEVVGIMHADRAGQSHGVTDDDRILLAEFAAVFGLLFDRASSEERLDQRIVLLDADLERAREELRRTTAPAFERVSEVAARAGRPVPADRERPSDVVLTAREREILEHVALGATNVVVAQRLTISEETVKSHMRRILRKLHVTSRNAAVARLRRLDGDDG